MQIYSSLNILANKICGKNNLADNNGQKSVTNACHTLCSPQSIPFYGLHNVNKLQSANNYLQKAKTESGKDENDLTLADFDLDKLDGIQQGIGVFKGLSMKEIAFASQNVLGLSVNHGCSSNCAHCFANAVPQHYKPDSDMINRVSYEDFNSYMGGYSKLNKRLGFNSLKIDENLSPYFAMFGDSDCIEMQMKDKNGKIYDFTDANEIAHKTTGRLGLFDTAGWNPKDKRYQDRAEKIVKYFSKPENYDKMCQIDISVNPFHSLNTRSIELKNEGNDKASQKFRDFYTDRMANAIYTFTPLMDKKNFHCISRAMEDSPKSVEGYQKKDLKELSDEIIAKVENKYNDDFNGEQKYIKSPEQINKYLGKLNYELKDRVRGIDPEGRAEKLFVKDEEVQKAIKKDKIESIEEFPDFTKDLKENAKESFRDIDLNGKVYINGLPTEIQFNFDNKNKKTHGDIEDYNGRLITKEMVKKAY